MPKGINSQVTPGKWKTSSIRTAIPTDDSQYSTPESRSKGDMRPNGKAQQQNREILHKQVDLINQGKNTLPKASYGKRSDRIDLSFKTKNKVKR